MFCVRSKPEGEVRLDDNKFRIFGAWRADVTGLGAREPHVEGLALPISVESGNLSFSKTGIRWMSVQTADMIAYETFQCLKQGGDDVWNKWPLVRQLLSTDRMRGRHQTEEQFVKMMREQDINRQYLKTVEKPKASSKKA